MNKITALETEIKLIADWMHELAEQSSAAQLADELDMPHSTVRHLLATDLRGATYKTLVKLAREMEGA